MSPSIQIAIDALGHAIHVGLERTEQEKREAFEDLWSPEMRARMSSIRIDGTERDPLEIAA